jgi:hypothetical protein
LVLASLPTHGLEHPPLLLLTVGDYKLRRWDILKWHNVHTTFHENQSDVSKVEIGDNADKDTHTYAQHGD